MEIWLLTFILIMEIRKKYKEKAVFWYGQAENRSS